MRANDAAFPWFKDIVALIADRLAQVTLTTRTVTLTKTKSPLLVPYVECGGVREYLSYVGGHAVWTKGMEAQEMTFYHSFPIRGALPLKWEEAGEFSGS